MSVSDSRYKALIAEPQATGDSHWAAQLPVYRIKSPNCTWQDSISTGGVTSVTVPETKTYSCLGSNSNLAVHRR
ncbi:MAG: hypothetical protein J07HR59_01267 [Halorubrum sp. J07HR59]|nr:MAG: hypothetical protein J07HR59_01267 [Halorubrum sp. J07HR59]